VVPLVFKTSLGAVRSPEGSTPSLLRQEDFIQIEVLGLRYQELASKNGGENFDVIGKRVNVARTI
jgi:hypothetical protein